MKIALLGSSPTLSLAPFNDPSWEIWACSDGSAAIPRCDLRFELHSFEFLKREPRYQVGSYFDDYMDYLKALPVYLQERHSGFPFSMTYPREEMVLKYGPFFFTSSIAWMFALALEKRPSAIGLWGVNMMADEEYGRQRPGFHYFYELARRQGIEVVLPPGCTLLDRPKWEGFDD